MTTPYWRRWWNGPKRRPGRNHRRRWPTPDISPGVTWQSAPVAVSRWWCPSHDNGSSKTRTTRTDSSMTSRATALRAHRGRRSRSSAYSMRTESHCVCTGLPAPSAKRARPSESSRSSRGHGGSCCAASLTWQPSGLCLPQLSTCAPCGGLGAPAPSSSYPTGRISIPLPDPNCAGSHPSPIHRHLRLSRQESFSKSHRLKPSAPTCYPLHHFWDRLSWVVSQFSPIVGGVVGGVYLCYLRV